MTRRTPRSVRVSAVLALGLVSLGSDCGEEVLIPPPTPILTVSPAGPITLEVGESIQLAASLQNSTAPVMFSSSNPAVAPVSSTGLVTAASPGTTTIIVSAGTLTQAVQVRVVAPVQGPDPIETILGLGGTYRGMIRVTEDPDPPEDPFIFDAGEGEEIVVNLEFEAGSADRLRVTLSGEIVDAQAVPGGLNAQSAAQAPSDLPTLTGDAQVDGSFTAEGSGTIAGFPDVPVRAVGQMDLESDPTEATIEIIVDGRNGKLPGNHEIRYEAQLTRSSQ